MGKKRKIDTVDLEMERTMYSSFVTAANAVSQLYTQGVQQQRRAAAAATKATLEKVSAFVLRQEEGSDHISKAALLQFLHHEYQNADSSDVSTTMQQPPQMQFMPFQQAAAPAASEETADTHPHLHKAHHNRQPSGSNMMTSPAGRSGSAGRLMSLEEQHQHQQHHQQHQQLHQHLQQQQHSAGLQPADAMQMHAGMMQMAAGAQFAGHDGVFMGGGGGGGGGNSMQ